MFQKAQNAAFEVLAGGTMVVGAGSVESIMALSPEQLVIDDEVLAIADRWRRGIRVTEETLAVEVVKRVGPRGSYLAERHARRAHASGSGYLVAGRKRPPGGLGAAAARRSSRAPARRELRDARGAAAAR
jgi:trimethylamine:corrinoid methyltransferase-like protein